MFESCLQYFQRRLTEGWKCVSLEGHNAVLLSPDGTRRELDLRNDVETLRPNAAGDETSIPSQYPASGYHWQKVDDEVADDSDYIVNSKGDEVYYRDLYGLPSSAIAAGMINKVTVHFRAKSSTSGYAKPALKSNGIVTDGIEVNLTSEWANYSQEWATNPADGAALEWSDINSLQIGVSLKDPPELCFTGDTRITMADGSYKEVKDIRPGDRVIYYDFIERKIKVTTVTKVNEHSADEIGPYYLVLNKVLKVTPEHPLDKPDGTVTTAGEVKVGGSLQGEAGSIEIFSVEKVRERVKTYSLETEAGHYFIDGFSDQVKPFSTYCSQLYVEVDYTPEPEVKTAVAPITVQPAGLVCDAELYLGPDEATPVTTSGEISFVSTGLQQSVRLPVMMPAEMGTYHVYLDVHVGEVLLVAYQAIEDMVIGVPLAGSIVGELIWYEGLAGWEEIVPGREIPLNEEIHLAPMWINESEINIVGHMDLLVRYPDGSQTALSAVLNQDKEAAPHNGKTVQFAPFLSTQEGTYTLEATLSSAGQVLDMYTFNLIVPVGGEPAAPV